MVLAALFVDQLHIGAGPSTGRAIEVCPLIIPGRSVQEYPSHLYPEGRNRRTRYLVHPCSTRCLCKLISVS